MHLFARNFCGARRRGWRGPAAARGRRRLSRPTRAGPGPGGAPRLPGAAWGRGAGRWQPTRARRSDANPAGGADAGGAAGHGVHLEIVAEEDAAKTEAVAEEVGADGARERGRSSAVERGVDDVRGHERGDAGAGRAREGHEVDGGERAARTVDARQDEMGIPCDRPVTREVLATGYD